MEACCGIKVGGNNYSAGNLSGGGIGFFNLSDDNFDHKGLNFIGGYGPTVGVGSYAGAGPGNYTGIAGTVGPASA